jgi:glycerol-3-phosphate acyltransferase PlsY
VTTALFVAAAYLVGSVPFGYWLVRATKHVDIRTVGSGNIGASNVWRAFGWRYGVPVMLFDIAKGLVPALVATQVAGSLAGVLAGGAAMVGHARPIFLGFEKGGKAVATAGGTILGVAPIVGLIGAGVWVAVFFVTRYASVASIVSASSLPLLAWLLGEPWPVIAFGAAAAAAVIVLHRQNIRRLATGDETRARPWRQQLRGLTARAAPSSGRTP